jgi:hypothetical protein
LQYYSRRNAANQDLKIMNREKQIESRRKKEREKKRAQRSKLSKENKQQVNDRDRIRKQVARSQLTSEEAQNLRERNRLRQQEIRANLTLEEVEHRRKVDRAHHQEARANLTQEQVQHRRKVDRAHHQEVHANLTQEGVEHRRDVDRAHRQEVRANLTVDDADQVRRINRIQHQVSRNNLTLDQVIQNRERSAFLHHIHLMSTSEGVKIERGVYNADINASAPIDISCNINIDECIKCCQSSLNRTLLTSDEDEYEPNIATHKILACVVCDQCIIGKDVCHWINGRNLNFHENVLSSSYFYKDGINPLLKSQYSIHQDQLVSHLLLSPRTKTTENGTFYLCCNDCYEVLKELKRQKKPPKYAISNGFAVGHLPENITSNITPLVNNLVAPIRAFNYFIAFSRGKELKITGNFTFFAQDVSQNIGALQHIAVASSNPSVFIVLLGSFTSAQLEKIRTQGSYNVDTFKRIYHFLHENNEHYNLLPPIDNIPMPVVEQINLNEEEGEVEEEGTDKNIEEPLCWKYWFPAVEDPNGHSGTFQNQSEFAQALFGGYIPTLFYHPTKVISCAKLSQLCPIAFPFGTGDVDCKQSPAVSEVDCLRHYLKLSLPQFQEGQTVLIIHHFFQRRKSFLSGITKCNISKNGNTIADQLATLTVDELENAIKEMRSIPPRDMESPQTSDDLSPHVKDLMKCIKTSCTPIGYTNEAAADARNKMFALWMTFGPPSLFFTFSPCDECSFKMHLYALGSSLELPSIRNPVEILSYNLSLRKALRVKYPGACAREFDSLLRIVLSDLIGWEGQEFKKEGIFGKVLAHATGVEEQGRTTLHGHIILWVLGYYLLQQQLFSNDQAIRNSAKGLLEKYLNKVLSSTFDITLDEVNRNIHGDSGCKPSNDKIVGASLQHLREMRHIGLLKKHHGKVISCDECNKSWDTVDVINSVIKELFHLSVLEYSSFWPQGILYPFTHEQIELFALRYQHDMTHIPPDKVHTRRLIQHIFLLV